MKFSDPIVGLEFNAMAHYIEGFRTQDIRIADIEKTAAYLCEWSKNLLNKTFGRTTAWECDQITALFRDTAVFILEQGQNINDFDTYQHICRYAEQIQSRSRQSSL